MKSIIFSMMLMMASSVTTSQNAAVVFKKMSNRLSEPKPLQFSTKYDLYRDSKTKVVQESYKGEFKKNTDNEVYMKIDNTEFVNAKNISLKINHTQKAIVVSNKEKFSTGDFDISKLLAYCKVSAFKENKTFWEITLTSNKFSGLTYSHIVLLVNKDYTIRKQVFFYNTGIDFSKDYKKQDITYPRLEITYSNYNRNVPDPIRFSSMAYISISDTKRLKPIAKYKDYEILDKRTGILKTN